MNKCKLCGYIFDEDNLEESIESHLQEKHYLGYQDYYEIQTLGTPYIECWKCGNPRYTLSPYLSSIHLPCTCCIVPEDKQTVQDMRNELLGKIKDFQGKLGKSKYYQYLLSQSPKDRTRLLPKEFEIQAENLLSLKRRDGVRLDKSSIFSVSNFLGRSSEISSRNLGALEMIPEEFKVDDLGNGKYKLGDLEYMITLPEIVPFDPKHHSRGSILNPSAKRASRRLKISGSGECIKFWNTPNLTVRSILFLSDLSGRSISYQDLPEDTKWKIRFGVLKSKPILTRVFEIYNEIFKFLSWIEDSVFLLNSVEIPVSPSEMGMKLTWSWEEQDYSQPYQGQIKLSIL